MSLKNIKTMNAKFNFKDISTPKSGLQVYTDSWWLCENGDTTKAFKRLIKFVMGNRNFRKILFGRNITDKVKPTYMPPADIDIPESHLPFY